MTGGVGRKSNTSRYHHGVHAEVSTGNNTQSMHSNAAESFLLKIRINALKNKVSARRNSYDLSFVIFRLASETSQTSSARSFRSVLNRRLLTITLRRVLMRTGPLLSSNLSKKKWLCRSKASCVRGCTRGMASQSKSEKSTLRSCC